MFVLLFCNSKYVYEKNTLQISKCVTILHLKLVIQNTVIIFFVNNKDVYEKQILKFITYYYNHNV